MSSSKFLRYLRVVPCLVELYIGGEGGERDFVVIQFEPNTGKGRKGYEATDTYEPGIE